ncbi:MAG: helix-turn-helix transcriptional regulator, partial [Ruminococcus flavefaciens]|nr:helix-turn-helix transcriptional regulator [Ruminococcus flavefaciens]
AAILEVLCQHILTQNMIVLEWQRYIDQFKRSIWDLLGENLDINTLCEAMGVGKTTLYKHFRFYSGTTIAHFITQTRIEKAMVLLTETDLSVTEISDKVGFNDYNYFCRVFKKKIGLSPQNYRSKNLK